MEQGEPSGVLIGRAQAGDRHAFDELVRRAKDSLRTYVASRLGARLQLELELDDVLQESYTRAFQSIDRFEWRGDGSFGRWLRGIADHVILKAAERRRRRSNVLEISREEFLVDKDPTPSRALRRSERMERLEQSLDSLTPDHRQVILLARIEGLQIKEIAKRMDRSESAIKNLLLRALRELRHSFGDTESLHLPRRSLGSDSRGEDTPRDSSSETAVGS